MMPNTFDVMPFLQEVASLGDAAKALGIPGLTPDSIKELFGDEEISVGRLIALLDKLPQLLAGDIESLLDWVVPSSEADINDDQGHELGGAGVPLDLSSVPSLLTKLKEVF